MHQSPSEWAELKNCQAAVLAANALQGSGTLVHSQEWTGTEVVQAEVVDEAVPVWEVDKEPKQVLSLINDSENRCCSIYTMLVHYYKLQASIQWYNEKAI